MPPPCTHPWARYGRPSTSRWGGCCPRFPSRALWPALVGSASWYACMDHDDRLLPGRSIYSRSRRKMRLPSSILPPSSVPGLGLHRGRSPFPEMRLMRSLHRFFGLSDSLFSRLFFRHFDSPTPYMFGTQISSLV